MFYARFLRTPPLPAPLLSETDYIHEPNTEEFVIHLAAKLAAAVSQSSSYEEAVTIASAYNQVSCAMYNIYKQL